VHVLIVDDNVGFARLLRNQLVPDGFAVSATNDPDGARASALANQPNVLVVDADLPSGGATRALEGICQVLKAPAHTFLLTERSPEKPDILDLAASFGASEVLVRPIPMLQFAEMIHSVVDTEPGTHPKPSDEVAEKPVAPWDKDPNWGMDRPEVKARTSRPVRDDPTLPRVSEMTDEDLGAALLPEEPERDEQEEAAAEAAQAEERPVAPWEKNPEWGAKEPEPPPPEPRRRERLPEKPPPLAPPVSRAARISAPPEEPVIQRPRVLNVGILRTLTKIWARRQTGTLKAQDHPGTALFADGAPADVMSEIFAKESLESTLTLSFAETRSEHNPRRQKFTDLLWKAAKELAEPQFLRFSGKKALEDCAWPHALDELPVHKDIKRIAQSADGYIGLKDLISAIGVDNPERLSAEMSALECMGLLKFAEVREAKVTKPILLRQPEPEPEPELKEAPKRRTGRLRMDDDLADEELRAAGLSLDEEITAEKTLDREPTLDEPAPKRRAARGSMREQMELKRLRREKEHLERSDDWTVLGIPPTEDRSQVKAAAARMRQRYQDIANDDSLPEEAHRLALDIAAMVTRSAERARPVAETAIKGTREDQAFLAGQQAMAAKDWDTAVRCFRTAYKTDLNNAKFMGFYGWSMWRLAEHKNDAEAAKMRDDGMEMLRLSDQFDNGDDAIQLYLATAEREKGEFARAEARCKRIQKRSPDFAGVDMLMGEIKRAKAAKD